MPKTTPIKNKNIEIQINPNTFVGASHAHVLSLSLNKDEITFEFIYIHPSKQLGHAISRVVMPASQAIEIQRALDNVIKQQTEKNK